MASLRRPTTLPAATGAGPPANLLRVFAYPMPHIPDGRLGFMVVLVIFAGAIFQGLSRNLAAGVWSDSVGMLCAMYLSACLLFSLCIHLLDLLAFGLGRVFEFLFKMMLACAVLWFVVDTAGRVLLENKYDEGVAPVVFVGSSLVVLPFLLRNLCVILLVVVGGGAGSNGGGGCGGAGARGVAGTYSGGAGPWNTLRLILGCVMVIVVSVVYDEGVIVVNSRLV